MVQNKTAVAFPSSPNSAGDTFVVKRVYHKGSPLVNTRNPILIRS